MMSGIYLWKCYGTYSVISLFRSEVSWNAKWFHKNFTNPGSKTSVIFGGNMRPVSPCFHFFVSHIVFLFHDNKQYEAGWLKWLREMYCWEMDSGLSLHCFPPSPVAGCETRRRDWKSKKQSKPELNQSYLFVLRGDTSKRVAFLAIVFLGSCLDIEARGSQPRVFKATPSRCHLLE